MADRSKIEWTDRTWNPVHGCSKVSPGCAHCYAAAISRRFGHTTLPWTPANAGENVILKPQLLDKPLRWREPSMVFVNSMSDLFHEQVPNDYIAAVFGVMAAAGDHTFQVLTKRPERMLSWFEWYADELRDREIDGATEAEVAIVAADEHGVDPALTWGAEMTTWPFPNVWLGVSIENRRFVHRADVLRATPAAVRFISAEPLLGPLVPAEHYELPVPFACDHAAHPPGAAFDVPAVSMWPDVHKGQTWRCAEHDLPALDLAGIDWLIAGGESGPGARAMDLGWARGLRDACAEMGVAFFLKQLGSHGYASKRGGEAAILDGRRHVDMPGKAVVS